MIEFGKITGDIENNLIEVRLRTGECLYAPVVIMGTNVTIPSATWISAYKDNFLALVTYEKDMFISPMIIGFYPVKGAKASSYNTTERLLSVIKSLVEQLGKATINTQIGPQQFRPDTLMVLDDLSETLDDIEKNINSIKL